MIECENVPKADKRIVSESESASTKVNRHLDCGVWVARRNCPN